MFSKRTGIIQRALTAMSRNGKLSKLRGKSRVGERSVHHVADAARYAAETEWGALSARVVGCYDESVADNRDILESFQQSPSWVSLDELRDSLLRAGGYLGASGVRSVHDSEGTTVTLPTDAQERKDTPVFSGFLAYFPLAIWEVAKLSKRGNDQHNPGKPLHWDRSKSGDEKDALTRHLLGTTLSQTLDEEIEDATAVAWRSMANLQKLMELKGAEIE